jgi:hypothetical protein
MLSIQYIRAESDRAAREAARAGKKPYVIYDEEELQATRSWPFPFIGHFVPKGWEKVEELFVDSSGFGSEDEPALTQRSFRAKLLEYVRANETYGFAITEVGQFQCGVGVYKANGEKVHKPRRKIASSGRLTN